MAAHRKNWAGLKLLMAAAMAGALAACATTATTEPTAVRDEQGRPTITAAERALAMWEVQNVMSRHAYYHAAGLNIEEVDAIWVRRDGEFASSATFASPRWVMNGIETVRGAYGEENQRNRERALGALSRADPSVANSRENLGAGHEWAMHTNTTPIIEIAGDGRTAKGVWYSPGMGLFTQVDGRDVRVQGTFFWEKYGADFVLENGQWRIWHLQMAYDFTPGLPEEWTAPLTGDRAGTQRNQAPAVEAGERQQGLPPGFSEPGYSYPAFSPSRPSIIYPPLPEPYYTFSETFSY